MGGLICTTRLEAPRKLRCAPGCPVTRICCRFVICVPAKHDASHRHLRISISLLAQRSPQCSEKSLRQLPLEPGTRWLCLCTTPPLSMWAGSRGLSAPSIRRARPPWLRHAPRVNTVDVTAAMFSSFRTTDTYIAITPRAFGGLTTGLILLGLVLNSVTGTRHILNPCSRFFPASPLWG
jgi:hypothetical protein